MNNPPTFDEVRRHDEKTTSAIRNDALTGGTYQLIAQAIRNPENSAEDAARAILASLTLHPEVFMRVAIAIKRQKVK